MPSIRYEFSFTPTQAGSYVVKRDGLGVYTVTYNGVPTPTNGTAAVFWPAIFGPLVPGADPPIIFKSEPKPEPKATVKPGASCARCSEWNEYAEAVAADGTAYCCWQCRQDPWR